MPKHGNIRIYNRTRIAHEIMLRFMNLPKTLPFEIGSSPTKTANVERLIFEWRHLGVSCLLRDCQREYYDVIEISFTLKADTVANVRKRLDQLSHHGLWGGKPRYPAGILSSHHPALKGKYDQAPREFFFTEMVIDEAEIKERRLLSRYRPE
jgi:hypothetical protein